MFEAVEAVSVSTGCLEMLGSSNSRLFGLIMVPRKVSKRIIILTKLT